MDMAEALTHLANGRCIRRPHWEPNHCVFQDEWAGAPVAIFHSGYGIKPFYNFPLNDLINDDWELYTGLPMDMRRM